MTRKCKICQEILRGRSDMIFCSLSCKNQYHQRLRKVTNSSAVEIDRYLKRNKAILLEILGKNKNQIKVYRNVLEQKRFRFKYHTHYHINSRDKIFHYVYDLAWMEFSDDEILIVRKI